MVGIISIAAAVILIIVAGKQFRQMHHDEPLFPSQFLTRTIPLSEFNKNLQDTPGDATIYCFEGNEPGGNVLIVGGTHPNEAAGFITAYLIIENLRVQQGTVYVLPRANHSAFTHNDPQEGHPQFFTIVGKTGERRFRYGSRNTNQVDQWPDPEIYLHFPSNQKLAGNETRNLNRAYPGKINGTLTERVAYAIVNFINTEHIDLAFDLHEAAPEYPVVNAIVSAGRSQELASEANIELQFEDLYYSIEPSPYNFHGLSHREWADFTGTYPILLETANPMQGRLRGKSAASLIMTGLDPMYLKAAKLGVLKVPYDNAGIPLNLRVGRHVAAIAKIVDVFSRNYPEHAIIVSGLPTHDDLITLGLGRYF
ncbi:succinylglutamate desuccinylase/aspartoacylase family protein [candidate division KSB1 bacterium]|nr:succinylglutamate desuccinylase/aspartoacylase family protein [candidate division KSB1 bacterium]